jgi:hypothetical protein
MHKTRAREIHAYPFAGHTTQIGVLAYLFSINLTKRVPMDSQHPKRQAKKPNLSSQSPSFVALDSQVSEFPRCIGPKNDYCNDDLCSHANLCSTTGEGIQEFMRGYYCARHGG